jgi:heat shock protein HslJ
MTGHIISALRIAAVLAAAVGPGGAVRAGEPALHREWRAISLDERPIAEGSLITLRFSPEGVDGNASCNRYRANIEVGEDTLTIGPIAATRMACPPRLMEQETQFLALLGSVRRYVIGPAGDLILSTADGRRIMAR